MMTQAFYTGISGLQANQYAIDAVSDNLANINTTGYRGYNTEFSSIFEETLSTVGSSPVDSSIGLGVKVGATAMNQSQGSLLLSGITTDIAIDGDGWFGVQGNDETLYTRAGSFTFDANSDLVTANDGYYVLGTMGGNITGETLTYPIFEMPLGDIGSQEQLRFPKTLNYPVEPTTETHFKANLGYDDLPIPVSVSVIDSQSNINQLELIFTKSALQNPTGTRWDFTAVTKTLDGNTIYDSQSGVVEFDERGAIVSNNLTSIDNNGTTVSIDLGSDFNGLTSIRGLPSSSSSSSNGTIGGDLAGYDINQNAEVIATFTNGRQSSVGKIALYHFQNDQGLDRVSGSRYREGSNSGEPLFFKYANGQSILGANVTNAMLEGSNVRMEVGLTELIILQRSYDANSKSITTADQMMQKALNMDA